MGWGALFGQWKYKCSKKLPVILRDTKFAPGLPGLSGLDVSPRQQYVISLLPAASPWIFHLYWL